MEEFQKTIKKLGGEYTLYPDTAESAGVKITFKNGYSVYAGFRQPGLIRTVEQIFKDAKNDIFLNHTASWQNKPELINEPFGGDFSSPSEFFMKAIISGIFQENPRNAI